MMKARVGKSIPFVKTSLYLAFGLLFLLMPYIAVLKHGFPLVKFGDSSLTALIKDALIVYVIVIGVIIISTSRDCFRADVFEISVCLLLFFAITKTIVSIATPLQAVTSFRHEFLFSIVAIILYRLCRIRVLHAGSIQNLFFITLALNLTVVVLIGYIEIANKDILRILYGEQALNLVTGIPGVPQIRSVSTLENPINLALFLTLCVTYFFGTAPRVSFWHIFLAIAILPLVVATFSRVFVVLYLFIFIALLIRYFVNSTLIGKFGLGVIVFAVAIIGFNVVVSGSNEVDAFRLVETRVQQTSEGIQSRDDPRFDNWEVAIENLHSFPVIGSVGGLGLGVSNPGDFEKGQFRIENSFLTIYIQLGLLGLLFYLTPTGMAVRLTFQGKMAVRGVRALAIVLIILIGGLTNDSHRNMPFSFYFWICLALSFLSRKSNSKAENGVA